MLATTLFADRVLIFSQSDDVRRFVLYLISGAEARRDRADYDTGSITDDEACFLFSLAELLHSRVVIEVGTFIGRSTTSIAGAIGVDCVYTCDASNDCLPDMDYIRTYPKQTSIKMLGDLAKKKVVADLCFFDGVLCEQDVNLLALVTHDRTVYAFHDYNYGPKIRKGGKLETMPRKGIGNVRLLQPNLPHHCLIEPFEGSTLALLVPEAA